MASITTRKNGSRFITFHTAGGTPRHITLGKIAKRYAESFKVRVEDLASAAMHGHAPSDDTARWLASLDDQLHAKLAAVELVPERQSATIGTLIDGYIAEREGDLKPESIRKLRQTETKLLAFFDAGKPLRKITESDAVAWRRSLKDLGLSDAAVRTHCGNVKTILAEAVRQKVIDENPFVALKSGPTPSKYTRYVTPEEIEAVIDACPDTEWRLLFGLARYAGLRIPSETHRLTWADVDFDDGTITITHGKAKRTDVVPMHPQLADVLRCRRDENPAILTARVFPTTVTNMTRLKDFLRAGIARRETVTDGNGEPVTVGVGKRRHVKTCIVTTDDEGREIDLHAMRTTLRTNLARHGVTPQVTQRIMRHADYRTTMRHYTVLGLTDTAAAIGRLPEIRDHESGAVRATGTDDVTARQKRQRLCEQLGRETMRNGAKWCQIGDTCDDKHDVSETPIFVGSNDTLRLRANPCDDHPQRDSNPCLQDENLIS